MTGIERLREFIGGIIPVIYVCGVTKTSYDREHMEEAWARLRDFLADIADQIERDHAEDCFMMGERAAEDAEAVAWVREHGGLDRVKAEWCSRVPYDLYERKRQRLLGHIAECETALGRRRRSIEELGHRVGDLTRENAELRKRAMPEGMEWPRYEDGSPVPFGDTLDQWPDYDGQFVFDHLEIYQSGELALSKTNGLRSVYGPGERVKYHAVLAADGEPLEVGQTVWHVSNGIEFTVVGLPKSGEYQAVKLRLDDGAFTGLDPDQLTHQRPVLDADGNRIEPPMDVWWVCEGDERGIHAEKLHVESIGEDGLVTCDPFNGGTWVELEPSELYVNRPVLDADGVPICVEDTVYLLPGEWCGEWPCLGFHGGEELVVTDLHPNHQSGGIRCARTKHCAECYPQPSQLTHTKPEPPKRCRDCRHWQGDPSASHMGVCFNSYRERCCVDSYAAQLDYAEACEDFEERGE